MKENNVREERGVVEWNRNRLTMKRRLIHDQHVFRTEIEQILNAGHHAADHYSDGKSDVTEIIVRTDPNDEDGSIEIDRCVSISEGKNLLTNAGHCSGEGGVADDEIAVARCSPVGVVGDARHAEQIDPEGSVGESALVKWGNGPSAVGELVDIASVRVRIAESDERVINDRR